MNFEAAVIVAEVRRNILPKTVSLLRRLQSLTSQSQTYLQNIGLQLEDHPLKMQDENLPKEDPRELLSKCKDVIASLHRILFTDPERQKIEKLINVALYAYQSIQ